MKALLCKLLSGVITLISLIAFAVNQPTIPNPTKKVDMSKFTLTFEDEFEDELDRSVWSGHYTYGDKSSIRKGSYWNNYMAYTENGNLIIPLRYLPDGMGAGTRQVSIPIPMRQTAFRKSLAILNVAVFFLRVPISGARSG